MGVPPVWAGALGGAASAAENGGNILEGAALGAAGGYVGGVAGGAAAEAGAGSILSGAAGGAAAGATGALLTGGDIAQGVLNGSITGAAAGGISQYVNPTNGQTTYTYDDGSTITRGADGNVAGSTPSPYQPAPVTDLSTGGPQLVGGPAGGEIINTGYDGTQGPVTPHAPIDLVSTGLSDSAAGTIYNGPNGPEIVLDSGKTVLLSQYEAALSSGAPISVDGNMTTGGTIEMSGLPRSLENPGSGAALPDGTELASIENSNGAKWNEELGTYVNPTTGAYFSQEANAWVQPAGATQTGTPGAGESGIPSSYVAPVSVNPDGSTTTMNFNGSVTTTYADGTSVTSNQDGSSVVKDVSGTSHVTGSGGGSGGGIDMGNGDTTYTYDDGSSITIHPDGTATSTPAPSDIPEITITADRPTTTSPVIETPVAPDLVTPLPPETVTPGGETIPYNPDGWTPTPVTPVFPVTKPSTPTTPVTPPYTEVPAGGTLPTLHIPTGLNPGWIAPTPFYQTTSPVQNQYFWGAHSFQEGPTFNAQQWNTVPGAPQHGWGLQEMAPVAKPQDIVNYINSPEYQSQFVSGPVAPTKA
jgi:hypothetical protein